MAADAITTDITAIIPTAMATLSTMVDKRYRRSKSEMQRLKDVILAIGAPEYPFTIRQMFYRMVSAGIIDKTEADYKNVVQRLCSELRESGDMPWDWVTDGTRLRRKPASYSNLAEALQITKECYRRNLWQNQDAYVEVWCEKDALTGVIYPVTAEWDVPLMIARGFASSTFLYNAAQDIMDIGKPTFIYYVGDFDPSGIAAEKSLGEKLERYAPDADIAFTRIAITPEQVRKHKLPTRPTKTAGNTHAKSFRGIGAEGDSIEADALPPDVLRGLVRDAITQHIDQHQFEITRQAEESERQSLEWLIRANRGVL